LLGYNDLYGSCEELWNTWLGVGRGISDSSALWLGACGGLASPSSCFLPIPNPPIDSITFHKE
jgi:hypothetical protein